MSISNANVSSARIVSAIFLMRLLVWHSLLKPWSKNTENRRRSFPEAHSFRSPTGPLKSGGDEIHALYQIRHWDDRVVIPKFGFWIFVGRIKHLNQF